MLKGRRKPVNKLDEISGLKIKKDVSFGNIYQV